MNNYWIESLELLFLLDDDTLYLVFLEKSLNK